MVKGWGGFVGGSRFQSPINLHIKKKVVDVHLSSSMIYY